MVGGPMQRIGVGEKLIGTFFRTVGQALEGIGKNIQGSTGYKEPLSKHRSLMALGSKKPSVPADTFVAPSATVVGNVKIGRHSSIWYGCVLRADVNSIIIGKHTSVQDRSVIHCASEGPAGPRATILGDHVNVGHGAVLHACTIDAHATIGIGAVVMDGAHIQERAVVGAGAVVTPKTVVPKDQVWAGNPAKFVRAVTPEEALEFERQTKIAQVLGEMNREECAKDVLDVMVDTEERELQEQRDPDYESSWGLLEGNQNARAW